MFTLMMITIDAVIFGVMANELYRSFKEWDN